MTKQREKCRAKTSQWQRQQQIMRTHRRGWDNCSNKVSHYSTSKSKQIPSAFRHVFAHQSTPRDVCLCRANCTTCVLMVSMQDKEERNTQKGQMEQLYHDYFEMTARRNFRLLLSVAEAWTSTASLQWQPFLLHMFNSLAPCLRVQTAIVARPLFSCLVWRLTKTNECKSMHASDQRLLLCGVMRKPLLAKSGTQTFYHLTAWRS